MCAKKVRISEVAEAAGVSKTTASHALSGKGRVSEETRQRVRAAAEQLGHRPNHVARSLATGRSQALGVVVVGLRGSWYADCVEGIEDTAVERGYSVLLGCCGGDPQRERELVERFLGWSVDGLVILSHWPEGNADLFRALASSGPPIVFIYNHLPDIPIDSVATDDFLGGYLAGKHLAQAGRRRILFLGSVDAFSWARSRLEGCNRALQEINLPPAVVLDPGWLPTEEECTALARKALQAHLQTGNSFDAVFGANDTQAWGALEALRDYGKRVPDEVAVVGFDDRGASAKVQPPLTTFRHAMRSMAKQAVDMLLERLTPEGRKAPPRRALFEPYLIVRESTGTLASQ